MLKPAALIILLTCFSSALFAQKATLRGKVSDTSENRNLRFATVTLLKKSDTTLAAFTRCDNEGRFVLPAVEKGNYVLLISYPRYADYFDEAIIEKDTDLGTVILTPASKLLDAVIVRSTGSIRIKGDTTEYVADSFHVKDGATVEDLLKKLPGLTVNSKGEIQAHGKRVDKVLVDGEEFFGDDPTMATQNISAKAVDRVQVYDTRTEQQKLTGLTTGSEGKTVNIKLKENAKKGSISKIYGGTDFNKYFDTKAFYNNFRGKRKVSIYGSRTNVSSGSLNWDDRQKLGIENDLEYDEVGGYYMSFGGGDEFNDWNIRGLPDAWTAGALFTNKWGNIDRNNINLSYRYNRLVTTNIGTTFTQNILPGASSFTNRYTTKNALNEQHAINGKYEWKLDSLASFKVVVVRTYKTSHATGTNNSEFLNDKRDTVNQSFNSYDNRTDRDQTDVQFVYKQMFRKKNRSLQSVIRYGNIDDNNGGLNFTRIRYFNNGIYDRSDTIDQQKLFEGGSISRGIKTTYTEPLNLRWTLILDYAWNKNHSRSLRNTYEKSNTGKYEDLVPEFSDNFVLDAVSNSGTVTFRYFYGKLRMGLGSGLSNIDLKLNDLDIDSVSRFHFLKVTPQVQINFNPKGQTFIGINYRGNSIQPNINQLQPLRDNTDPLNEYKGNPDLKVGFNHNISIFYNSYKVLSQTWKGLNFAYNIQQNAITMNNTIDVTTGKRTYFPVNVQGNRSWYLWSNFGRSGGNKKPEYGFGFNGNGSTFHNFVNGVEAITRSYNIGVNLNFGIENEDHFEFNIQPRIGYNFSKSSVPSTVNNNYFNYGGESEFSVEFSKFEITNKISFDLRQRIEAFSTNTNTINWNFEFARKLFKKDIGKISFLVNDLLNQNKGFNRSINSTFISEDRFQRIGQYFLLKFTITLTKNPDIK
jgi:hypothetical protein